MKAITKTFSIDDELYESFERTCRFKNINKSSLFQEFIKNYITDNYIIDLTKTYRIKGDKKGKVLTVKSKEEGYLILSNGNKLEFDDFDKCYESTDIDVERVLHELNPDVELPQEEIINPTDFLNNSILVSDLIKSMVDKIDISKLSDNEQYPSIKIIEDVDKVSIKHKSDDDKSDDKNFVREQIEKFHHLFETKIDIYDTTVLNNNEVRDIHGSIVTNNDDIRYTPLRSIEELNNDQAVSKIKKDEFIKQHNEEKRIIEELDKKVEEDVAKLQELKADDKELELIRVTDTMSIIFSDNQTDFIKYLYDKNIIVIPKNIKELSLENKIINLHNSLLKVNNGLPVIIMMNDEKIEISYNGDTLTYSIIKDVVRNHYIDNININIHKN